MMKLDNIIKNAIKIYEYVSKHRAESIDEKNMEMDLALVALQNASNDTRLYLNSIAKGKLKSIEKEKELSSLWNVVGFSLRGIDKELSTLSFEKSDYWLNPESYNLVEIGQVNIGLNNVTKQIKLLLQR